MADYFWKGGSGSNGWSTAANWVNSGGSAYGTPPTASDTVIFDDTGQTDCVLDNTNLTANYIYIDSDFGHSLTMSGLSAKVVMNGMEVSKAAVFNFTASTEFELRSTASGWTSYVNSSSTTSNNLYIRYLIDSSPFANDTSRYATIYDFNSKDYCLVDGVYPTIDRPGNLEAKAIFKDTSGGAFNSYGSVDLLAFTNNEFTSTSTNPDVYDYDKEFYFEGRYGSDSSLAYRIGENFKFGHTTVIFRAGTDSNGQHFQVPVKGDIISSGSPRGNTTTNVFNVQYHKVIIRAPPLLSEPRYCYIEDGRTLECNELVIEAGGRLYGPAEGEQVASSKIKSVKRPTVQGDWNFKQIADGIYESIDNIPTLPVTEGGTGLNIVEKAGILYGDGQNPLGVLSLGTATQVLVVNDDETGVEWGQPEHLHIQVRNDEGTTIPVGAPLYSKGEIGGSQRILVGIADAGDPNKMPCIGIANAEMNTTTTKDNYATVGGVYNTNLDSGFSGLNEGDIVYVKNWSGTPTAPSDVLTTTKPTGPTELVQNVGIILKTNGTIIQGLLVSVIGRTNDVPNTINIEGDITSNGNISALDGTITGNTFVAGYAAGDAIFRTYNPADHLELQTYDAGTSAFVTELEILNDQGGIQITNDVTSSGDLTLDRGSATSSLTRALTIGGARNATDGVFAEIAFKNYDSNSGAADYTAGKIRMFNNPDGDDDGTMAFYTANNETLNTSPALSITDTGYVRVGPSGSFDAPLTISQNTTTTGPSGNAQLVVKGSGTSGQDASIEVRGARNSSTTAVPTSIKFTNYDNDLSSSNILGAVIGKVTNHTTNVGSLILQTSADGSALSDRLTITSAGNVTIANDLTVQGDFTVSGTTTTVDTTNLNITDNIITLNDGETGAGVTLGTAGIDIDRGTATNATFLYDDSIDGWVADSQGTATTLKLQNTHGYIEFGPQNTSYAHITTDRSRFYFNRDLVIGENAISSYNGDFSIRRSQSTDEQIVIGDDSMTFTSAGNDVLSIDGTNSRLAIGTSTHSGGKLTIDHNVSNPSTDAPSSFGIHIDADLTGSTATGGDREQGGIFVDLDSSATGGDASDEHRPIGVWADVRLNSESDADAVYGIYGYVEAQRSGATGATTGLLRGGYFFAATDETSDHTVSDLTGALGYASIQDAGTVSTSEGLRGFTNVHSNRSTNVGNLRGVSAEVDISGGRTNGSDITTGYSAVFHALLDHNPAASGEGTVTVANSYLYYGSSSITDSSQVTNDWGLYLTGEDKNYFSGKVGIGTTSPEYELDVDGTIRILPTISSNAGTAIRIGAGGNSNDITLLRIDGADPENQGESDSAKYGFSMKYMGSGTGDGNRYAMFMDNQEGTAIEAMSILQNGKVGIGVSAPTVSLDVNGDVFIGDSSETTALSGSADLTMQGDTALVTFKADNGSSGDIIAGIRVFADSFRSAGMIIGDYNNTTGATTEDWLIGRQYASANKVGISATPENGGDEYLTANSDGQKAVKIAGDNDDIDFIIHGSSGEYFRAEASTGRIGIGVSSPSTELEIASTGTFKLGNAELVANQFRINNTGGYAQIELGGSSGAYIDMKTPFSDDFDARIITAGSDMQLITASASTPILLKTNGTTRMSVKDDRIELAKDLHFATGTTPKINGGNQNPLIIYGDTDGNPTSTSGDYVTWSTASAVEIRANSSEQTVMRAKDNKEVDFFGLVNGPGRNEGAYGANSFHFGDTGSTEADDWYEVFRWSPNAIMTSASSPQYRNFAARFKCTGRGNARVNFDIYVRGEYGIQDSNGWWAREFIIDGLDETTDDDGNASPDADSLFLMVYNAGTSLSYPYASLYMRRDENWEIRTCNLVSMYTNCVFEFLDNNVGETTPTNDGNTGSYDQSPSIRRKLFVDNNNQLINGVGATGIYFDDTNDRLGIGTSSPTYALDVVAASDSGIKLSRSGGASVELLLEAASGDNRITFSDGGTDKWCIGKDNTDNSFRISDGGALGANDRITIDSTGNVGIGTGSPSYLLDVAGNARFGTTGVAGNIYLSADAAGSYIGWNSSGTDVTLAADDDLVLHADDAMLFQAGAATKMTLLSSGNLGIGETSPSTPLHIKSTTTTLDNLLTLENNGASGTPGVGIKMFSNVGTTNYLEILHDAFGATNFKTTNGASSYNKQMHLQSDGDVSFEAGDVGVGTASPNQKLTVEGSMSLKEQTSSNSDTASYGQLWVKNASPNQLWFTNDTGIDIQITDGTGVYAPSATVDFKPAVFMDSGNVNITLTETTIPFDTEVLDPSSNAALVTGLGNDGKIRLTAGGYYQISYSIPINDDGSTGADRTRVYVVMQVDDNSLFSSPTTVAQSRAQVYTREASGGSGLSTTFIYNHTANDYIRLRIDAQQNTDISTETNQSQISIQYLGT